MCVCGVCHTTVRVRIPTAVHRVLSRKDDPRIPTYIFLIGRRGVVDAFISDPSIRISDIYINIHLCLFITITIRLNNYYRKDRVLQHRGMFSNRKVITVRSKKEKKQFDSNKRSFRFRYLIYRMRVVDA